jgi:hypothetical protein
LIIINIKLKKMNTKPVLIPVLFALAAIISGCKKEISKPEIKNFELGYNNNKIAYIGDELHIDAEIIADGKIDRIIIEIHPEGDHHKSAKGVSHDDEWEIEIIYTEFSGLKNTDFHKHIDVPDDAEPGDYHIHFKVIDMEGNTTSVEDEFEVREPEIK